MPTKTKIDELIAKAYEAGRASIIEHLTPQERDKVRFLEEHGADKTDYRGKDFLKVRGVFKMRDIYNRMRHEVEF
jgi:hypothetical protein